MWPPACRADPCGMTNSNSHRWLTLPVILMATFMASFDYMVVNVAAPSLGRDLHAGQAALELVIGGYAFTYASGMVTGGRLGDLFGHRRVFALGMTGFTIASLLCGLAQSPGQLVAGRLLQGVGAAAMAPQVLALITSLFPAAERPRAFSWFGVALGIGGIAGQVFGGLLLDADVLGLGWRVLFLVNVPVGAVAVPLTLRLLPRTGSPRRPRLDPVGAVGVSAALAMVLVPLALGREQGWPAWTFVSLVAAVPVLAGTLAWERRLGLRNAEPLVDLSLFGDRAFTAGLAVNVAFMATMSSFMFVMTLLLQSGLGLDARSAGLAFGPMGVLSMASSLLGRRLGARFGRGALLGGSLVSVAAMLILVVELGTLGSAVTVWWLIIPSGLFGLGGGLTVPMIMATVLAGVRPAQAGAASGVLTTAQQFAGAAGIAVLGTVFFAALGSHPDRGDFASAAALAAGVDLALTAVSAALVGLLPGPATAAPQAKAAQSGEPLLSRRI
jgi:EmrB/QacA subfamily drug resistance transporter